MSIKEGMIIRNEKFEVIPYSKEREIECVLFSPTNGYSKYHLSDKDIDIIWSSGHRLHFISFKYKDVEIKRIKGPRLQSVKDQLNVYLSMSKEEIMQQAQSAGESEIDVLTEKLTALKESKSQLHEQIFTLKKDVTNLLNSIEEIRASLDS